MFEGTPWIYIVAGINSNLLTILCCNISGMGGEVHIGHQRSLVTVCLQTGRDVFHVFCLTSALGCETYQLASGIDDAFGLSYAGFRIVGVGCSHRLNADGVVATNGNVADMSHTANSSCTHTLFLLNLGWLSQSWLSSQTCSRPDVVL